MDRNREHLPAGTSSTRNALLLVFVLWALGFWWPANAGVTPARPPQAGSDYWSLNSALIVELHQYDRAEPVAPLIGEVFDSPDFQCLLLWLPDWPITYVLELGTGRAHGYRSETLVDEHGRPLPPPANRAEVVGIFLTQPDGSLVFSTSKSDLLVRPAPELVGEISRRELEARLPGIRHRTSLYVPDSAAVEILAGVDTPSEIAVFFGSWCTSCRAELPALLRTLDITANPNLGLRLIGVDEDLAEPYLLLEEFAVGEIPSLLVLQGGVEIGRISDEPQRSVEGDLAGILDRERPR